MVGKELILPKYREDALSNQKRERKLDEKCTIWSSDVTALYPSIDVEFASERVSEMFMDS